MDSILKIPSEVWLNEFFNCGKDRKSLYVYLHVDIWLMKDLLTKITSN